MWLKYNAPIWLHFWTFWTRSARSSANSCFRSAIWSLCFSSTTVCSLFEDLGEKLGNMVIVFYIKHSVQRDQPQVQIGKTPQFTWTYLETYTQFDTWTELQGKKGSLDWESENWDWSRIFTWTSELTDLSRVDPCWHEYQIQLVLLLWHRKMEITMAMK